MKYAIALCLIALPLNACAPSLINLKKETLSTVQPDVPGIAPEVQLKAAEEMEAGQCPALNVLANTCLITRDQSRALQGIE